MEPNQTVAREQPSTLTWKEVLQGERESEYFKSILAFLESERAAGKVIYPKLSDIFNALQFTPFEEVKVVIIGQDPYHGPGQAHGLCFSVKPGVPAPPSLVNIFKELQSDCGIPIPKHGYLEKWARQGVLLLNATLSVESGKPQSHSGIGWERFTDRIIREINERKEGIVFLLWGASAQKKGAMIDRKRHTVLETVHPSPLSAHRGFLGCKHFSKTNQILEQQGKTPIDWSL
ncbi:MAG: uracil-DNA glycosylase [Deltaproteobacteria bacterium]|nr:uracil-DNA glycosylase [Deltaproteobacteria bacterium]